MAEELSAELELSIKDALSEVDDLRDEIEKAVRDSAEEFEDQFAKAISGVPDVEIVADTDKVEPAITDALGEVDTAIPIEADTATVEPTITDAISSVDGAVPIEADITEVAPSIDEAIASVEGSVPIEADVSDVPAAIDAAVGAATATITVDADTDAASAEMALLGQDIVTTLAVDADTAPALADIQDITEGAVTDRTIELAVALDTSAAQDSTAALGGVSDEAEESISGAAAATSVFGTASNLSSGSIDAATNAVGGFLSKMGPVGGAIAGSVVALGAFTNQAVSSLGATERLNRTMGEFADNVENIDVGSLNTSLKQLALDTGSSGSAMRNAAADSFQMVTSFGVGKEAASQYSAQVLALAARAVSLNPALGETGEVATRLSNAFRSGRDKALVPYALGITSVEINSRAASIALADGGREVTQADKAMAGAALATEKLGGGLKKNIEEGSKNPIIAVRTLTKEFSAATTEIGKPLVAPVLELLDSALPSVKAIGGAIGDLAEASLPLLVVGLKAITPLVEAFANGLEALGPGGIQLIGVVAAIGYALSNLSTIITTVKIALTLLSASFTVTPIGLMAAGLGLAVTALGLFTGGSEDASQATDQLTDAIIEQNGAISENAIDLITDQLGGLISGLTKADISTTKYTNALQTAQGATRSNVKELSGYMTRVNEAGAGNEYFIGVLERTSPALGKMAEQLVKSGNASYDLKAAIIQQVLAVAEAGRMAKIRGEAEIEMAKSLDFTKEKTDQAVQAAKAHKQALFESKAATAEYTVAAQAQAQVDAFAVQNANDRALATREVAAGQAVVTAEMFTGAGAFSAAEDAANRYKLGIGSAAELTDALARASSELNSELDVLLGRFLSADESTNNFKLAMMDLGTQLMENGFAFDENSEAGLKNQNIIDQLGQQAITTSGKILQSTGDFAAAKQPLEDFRGSMVKLRDDMRNAGQDTAFLDGIITNVDAAIAGVTARAPNMTAAGQALGAAGPAGLQLTEQQWRDLGAYLGDQGSQAALGTLGSWTFTGDKLGKDGAQAALNTRPFWETTGSEVGTAGKIGVENTNAAWGTAASTVARNAVNTVGAAAGPMRGTGQGVGEQGASGYGTGMGGMSNEANRAVLNSIGTIATAGVEVASFAVGVGQAIGKAFVAGIAAGINAGSGAVSSAARRAVSDARAAAEAEAGISSPSKLFAEEVGLPIAQGVAIGITKGSRAINAAAGNAVGAALDGSRGYESSLRASGSAKTTVQFNIAVHGVSDPTMARTVGEQIGRGAADVLTQRNVVTTARLG